MKTIAEMLTDLHDQIAAWDGIESVPHRFGGTEFKFGKVEIGHFHRGGMVDIPFTRALRDVLIAEGSAEPHHLLHESGWITYYVRSEDDARSAQRLFRLSYLHKVARRGRLTPDALRADLDGLHASDALRALIDKPVNAS
ncbi:MAG: DUF5519 family protein [Chloroflexota bacterium]|nr:DUF5519 family protein [Chloroflexota bacterium]